MKSLFKPRQAPKKTDGQADRWPRPPYDAEVQPHFLFILTTPYSGSTALARLIDTSARTTLLHPKGEAQWLVPGLCGKDRWKPDLAVDYASVKAVWLSRYQQICESLPGVDTVVEKSPPNMMRIDQLAAQFHEYSLLANNRDPYAYCASLLYRNHPGATPGSAERERKLNRLAGMWLRHSARLREVIEARGVPLLTYERFCSDPASLLPLLRLPPGVAQSIDFAAEIKVKNYPPQGIVDQNARQIAQLTPGDIEVINARLREEAALLAFFGYALR